MQKCAEKQWRIIGKNQKAWKMLGHGSHTFWNIVKNNW